MCVQVAPLAGILFGYWLLFVAWPRPEGKGEFHDWFAHSNKHTNAAAAEEFHGHQDHPCEPPGNDLRNTLNECAASGETVVVEMPDQRLLAIQPLEAQEEDSLIDELLQAHPQFQALVAKSKASPRKLFALEE
jgi:hypothetical protein